MGDKKYNNREYRRKYYEAHPWAKTLCYIMTRCSEKSHRYYKKGIKNFISTPDLKFLWFRDKAYLLKRPSIDRIDSKGHYTLGNCRYIELEENQRQGGLHITNKGRKLPEETKRKMSIAHLKRYRILREQKENQ